MTKNIVEAGAQVFESRFHRWYVGGEGLVVEKPLPERADKGVDRKERYLQVLAEFRRYVRDSEAILPDEVLETMFMTREEASSYE